MAETTLQELCKNIKLIITDVDGVLTTGGISYSPNGETKTFDVQDGAGIKYAQRAGLEVAIITGRTSEALARRCEELNITDLVQGSKNKIEPYNALLQCKNLAPEEICYIGDDFPDIPPLRVAGLSVAPSNALSEVKLCCNFITSASGGTGALRELIMIILKQQGTWDAIYSRYR